MKTAISCLLLCMGLLLSCNKQESNVVEKQALAGTWKLIEILADPGDGSGKWKPVAGAAQTFITFYADGRMESTAFTGAKHYEVASDTKVTFTFMDGTYIHYNYARAGSVLEISSGGCVEACGARFRKEMAHN